MRMQWLRVSDILIMWGASLRLCSLSSVTPSRANPSANGASIHVLASRPGEPPDTYPEPRFGDTARHSFVRMTASTTSSKTRRILPSARARHRETPETGRDPQPIHLLAQVEQEARLSAHVLERHQDQRPHAKIRIWIVGGEVSDVGSDAVASWTGREVMSTSRICAVSQLPHEALSVHHHRAAPFGLREHPLMPNHGGDQVQNGRRPPRAPSCPERWTPAPGRGTPACPERGFSFQQGRGCSRSRLRAMLSVNAVEQVIG